MNTFSGFADLTDCGLRNGAVYINTNGYVADGRCYAFESGNYFKATCDGTQGMIYSCSDAQCSSCTAVTNSETCNKVNEGYSNAYCVFSADLLVQGVAATTSKGATTTNTTTNNTTTGNKNGAVGSSMNDFTMIVCMSLLLTLMVGHPF